MPSREKIPSYAAVPGLAVIRSTMAKYGKHLLHSEFCNATGNKNFGGLSM